MGTNRRNLKAYVRYDSSGRVIPGGVILRESKPKVGNWKEVTAYECCNPVSYNFDITANWSLTTPAVVDEASFRTFLESGEDGDGNTNLFTNIVITDFSLVDGRLQCNLSANTEGEGINLALIGVTIFNRVGNITGAEWLYMNGNNLTEFNPKIALPSSVTYLDFGDNQIVTFNPTIALSSSVTVLTLYGNNLTEFNPTLPLPSSLIELNLGDNQIVIFNPTLPLPDSLLDLNVYGNQMTTAGYTASEPWANAMSTIPGRGNIYFQNNNDSVSGTNLETILIAKGWNVVTV